MPLMRRDLRGEEPAHWVMFRLELVGALEHSDYDFPYIGNVIIPTDEVHHFSEGLKPPTSEPSEWGFI